MNALKFEKYDLSVLEQIEKFLEHLTPVPRKIYDKDELFQEDSFLFAGKKEMLPKIEEDIFYQERIAKAVIRYSEENKTSLKLNSYFWQCTLEKTSNSSWFRAYKFMTIGLYVDTGRENAEIIFPIQVIQTENGEYEYWEILHIDVALEAVAQLLKVE